MKFSRSAAGFSLIELAIALLIITLLAAGATKALNIQFAQRHISQTNEALYEAKQAILAFAVAHERIPCPDTDFPPDGLENRTGTTDVQCTSARGGVPFASLGIPTALDGWAQPNHYLVTPQFARETCINGSCLAFLTTTPGQVLINTPENACIPSSLTTGTTADAIAFALWSSAEDGLNASAAETGSRVIAPSNTCPIDDMLIYVSRYSLLKILMDAGVTVPRVSSASSAASSSP